MTSRFRRPLIWLPLLALTPALLLPVGLGGCTEDPEPPVWDNPFDPRNPDADDPFALRAVLDGDGVELSWTQLDGHGIATYEVQKSLDALNFSAVGDTAAGSGEMVYRVTDITPTATNYFRVRALDADGQAPRMSQVTPASVNAGPLLAVAGPAPVLSRFVDLQVTTTAGDSVQVASDALFASPRTVALGDDGTALVTGVDLGQADGPDTTFVLYARALTDVGEGLPPAYSAIGTLELGVGLAPSVALPDGGDRIASPLVDVALADSGAGIARVRFALAADDLADAPWRDAAPVLDEVPVADTVQPQTLFAELETEFGYRVTGVLELAADDLADATFAVDLPPDGIAPSPRLDLLHDAVATEMRVSEDPGFADAPWVAYADTSSLVLAGQPGRHQVYAQYRNHWFTSAVRAAEVVLAGGRLEVAFTHPLDDQVVRGGASLAITGTADPFDPGYAITAVRVHLGDGWVDATGGRFWQVPWDVPRLTRDTDWYLGVEAIAANADSSDIRAQMAWIEVVISQLAVTIASPAPQTELVRGQQATIGGTASPYLAGAPLDSVVVVADGTRLPASGDLTDWSVAWNVPAAGEVPLDVELVAWAHAGADSVRAAVPVTLVAPPPEE